MRAGATKAKDPVSRGSRSHGAAGVMVCGFVDFLTLVALGKICSEG